METKNTKVADIALGWPWDAEKQAKIFNQLITSKKPIKHHLENKEEKGNPRLPLQRDRDRIVWSKSFKRLAHKTQVFPHLYSDHQRHRMSHSLEVMQLATSIARTLGLNSFLCEAIALAHDLGHTPFGHAGESALDGALSHITKKNIVPGAIKGLSRFSHNEQGLDVVCYLDSLDPDHKAEGLRLNHFVKEGIFKHTFDHTRDDTKHNSLRFLLANTKYKEFDNGSGSLESQVVRICDKLSYLISDIEDGLIIGAIHLEEFRSFKLFNDLFPGTSEKNGIFVPEDDYRRFRDSRDKILTAIVESIIKKASKAKGDGSLEIEPENPIKTEMADIYEKIQKNLFYKNILVLKANLRAKHIVSCLICQYLRHPELIPWRFRRKYSVSQTDFRNKLKELYLGTDSVNLDKRIILNLNSWFVERGKNKEVICNPEIAEIKDRMISDIICAKDFITGMTDNYSEERFKGDVDCFGSRQAWKEFNMGKSTFYETMTVRGI